ncbi:MAG: maleylpyruvate isomerase N-terminal domain-containing protein, partial [Mycobacterium sp.]
MYDVPVTSAGLADQIRRADVGTRAALADAVGRSAELWRSVDEPGAPVPGLAWTAAETAAHVTGDLREYTEALNGRPGAVDIPDEPPARLRTAVNARHLTAVPERDPHRLADLLEQTAVSYLAVAAARDTTDAAAITTADGLVLEPAFMTCLLLGEQLIHGLDIARAAHRPWAIGRDDALRVIPAVLALAPNYLRVSRTENLHVSFELR